MIIAQEARNDQTNHNSLSDAAVQSEDFPAVRLGDPSLASPSSGTICERTEWSKTAMEPDQNDRRPAIWMVTAAFSFASMGAFAHAVGPRCDWLVIALVRIISTFVFSVSLAWIAGARLVLRKPRTLWIRSISGTISLLCSFYALTHLPVADVLTLTNTYPLWIVLLSLRQVRRNEIALDLLCVVSGVVGVVLIQRPYLSGQGNLAVAVALLGSVTTAVAMLGLHRLRSVDARAVVAHFSGLASLVLAGWVSFHPAIASASTFDQSTFLMLLGVGLSGTIAQVFLTKAFASGPPSRISVLSLTQVVFAMGYDIAFEGRILGPSTLVGFALVLVPTGWITLHSGRMTVEPISQA
jgi:drug/metabolite transporter (DMT)-like permease